mgnify:CR=1 FL=1|tara:strand:- start:93 stop:1145 length:1053 start_codon:yes stop_codon:yes gene_type:complete
MRKLEFNKSINEALEISMKKNSKVILLGLGVDDPKSIFGTTHNLVEKFGKKRVFDMPTAENGMTGIAIGASLSGFFPVITHQRVEFALLSMEQIINQAAKWFYMNAGQMSVPIVIRLIVGRGWGQGPQHSQSLENLFSSIPGLKVVCPSSARDAKGLLISSIEDKNPVIFYEHRWLHQTYSDVPKGYYKTQIGKCNILKKGKDITIVSNSYMSLESYKAAKVLKKIGIDAEVIDLRSLRPLDSKTILSSVNKTKKLLVVDGGWPQYGISSEIISIISEKMNSLKKIKTSRLSIADVPIPSTRALAKFCYPSPKNIVEKTLSMLNKKNKNISKFFTKDNNDVPDKSFQGPF